MSPLALVTGGTGAIGPSVVAVLREAGYCVRLYSRNAPATTALPAGVEHYSGDITDMARVEAAMKGVDVVFHLAALLHVNNSPPALRPHYYKTNVQGTQCIVEAAQQADVRRVVFSSTIAVYDGGRGHLLTEEEQPQPDSIYGETKLAAETIVLQAKRRDGEPLGVVLRLASTYGGHVKGNYRRLVHSLARGRFLPIGPGENRRTLVHEDDAAAALLLAANHAAAAGQIYNVADGTCHTMAEVIESICAALERRPPILHLPVGPVRTLAGVLEESARTVGWRSPINRATINKYLEDVQVSSTRIQQELGFRPQYDLAMGWREAVRAMRAAGEL